DGTKYDFYLFSFDPNEPQGAPWKLSSGTDRIGGGEIVLSDVLAKKLKKSIGDDIELLDRTFQIKGLAAEASSIGLNYAWISFEQARAMVTYPDQVNFAYVTLNDSGSAEVIAARLKTAYPHLSILDKPTFVANNLAEIEESFLPIIRAIVLISIVIGIAVIGLTIYTATIDKSREYGILKAIGVTNRQLYLIVLTQAVISMVIGLGLGIGLSYLLAQGLADWINLLPEISLQTVRVVVTLGLGMGFLASFVPVRRLVAIDPAEVFKA
ncbi:FtsX-like permease family protein, partial [Candidatus Berkelbacteria bacterium]|nr:FtsX-like permease family protein [Candidatus Berkelbacteria bacterium]